MQKKERMANLEVLRCVAMMMVVVLHYLGKGGLLPDLTAPLSVQDMAAWLLEAICIVAVNVYMMISGYFLCESSFKLSRLLTLWLQLWLYSVGIGVLAALMVNSLFPGGFTFGAAERFCRNLRQKAAGSEELSEDAGALVVNQKS